MAKTANEGKKGFEEERSERVRLEPERQLNSGKQGLPGGENSTEKGGHDRVKELDTPNSIAGALRCFHINRELLLSIDASMQSMAYLRVHAQYSYILQFLHSTTFIYWHACNNIIFLAQARPTMSCILLVYIPLDKMSKFNTSF